MTIIPRKDGNVKGEFILSVLAGITCFLFFIIVITFDYNTGHRVGGTIFILIISILLGVFTYNSINNKSDVDGIELFFVRLLFRKSIYKHYTIDRDCHCEICTKYNDITYVSLQNGLMKFLFIKSTYIFNDTLCVRSKKFLYGKITRF